MSTVEEEIQQGNIQFLGNVWVPQSRGYLANTESRSEGWRMVDMIFK